MDCHRVWWRFYYVIINYWEDEIWVKSKYICNLSFEVLHAILTAFVQLGILFPCNLILHATWVGGINKLLHPKKHECKQRYEISVGLCITRKLKIITSSSFCWRPIASAWIGENSGTLDPIISGFPPHLQNFENSFDTKYFLCRKYVKTASKNSVLDRFRLSHFNIFLRNEPSCKVKMPETNYEPCRKVSTLK